MVESGKEFRKEYARWFKCLTFMVSVLSSLINVFSESELVVLFAIEFAKQKIIKNTKSIIFFIYNSLFII
jgi:hypothetical protein